MKNLPAAVVTNFPRTNVESSHFGLTVWERSEASEKWLETRLDAADHSFSIFGEIIILAETYEGLL